MTRALGLALLVGCNTAAKDDTGETAAAGAWYDGAIDISGFAVACEGEDFAAVVTTRGWTGGVIFAVGPAGGDPEEHPLTQEARDADGWWERWSGRIEGSAAWTRPGAASVWSCARETDDELTFEAWALDRETGEVAACLALQGGEPADCASRRRASPRSADAIAMEGPERVFYRTGFLDHHPGQETRYP